MEYQWTPGQVPCLGVAGQHKTYSTVFLQFLLLFCFGFVLFFFFFLIFCVTFTVQEPTLQTKLALNSVICLLCFWSAVIKGLCHHHLATFCLIMLYLGIFAFFICFYFCRGFCCCFCCMFLGGLFVFCFWVLFWFCLFLKKKEHKVGQIRQWGEPRRSQRKEV